MGTFLRNLKNKSKRFWATWEVLHSQSAVSLSRKDFVFAVPPTCTHFDLISWRPFRLGHRPGGLTVDFLAPRPLLREFVAQNSQFVGKSRTHWLHTGTFDKVNEIKKNLSRPLKSLRPTLDSLPACHFSSKYRWYPEYLPPSKKRSWLSNKFSLWVKGNVWKAVWRIRVLILVFLVTKFSILPTHGHATY